MPTEAHPSSAARPLDPEAIAIIGVGCRFPGANGPRAFWRLLREGVDAITEVPAGRWDIHAYYDPELSEPGKMSTRWGGFIDGVDAFEPAFFGVSQGEASSMDPQHRLLLEVSWEALEDAGLSPRSLAGSPAGVFVGIGSTDYARACFEDEAKVNAYFAAGNALCFASNRVSKFFDLRGPSISLDTGCSSSLFAIHLACQSLRAGDTDLALAAGINLLLSPLPTIATSQAWLMAADGRCKSFDAAADGYVRSEGCGVVVLKRLSDALAHGDTIWGVIRGCAVNQDGHGESLTTPNPAGQGEVIRKALQQARLSPQDIDYIEAHGVGTKAADLAEAQALGAVFGEARAEAGRKWIGSVKTNIGHLEAAAGMAALIKVLLGLRHELIPRHLHFTSLPPEIAASGVRLDIATEPVPWAQSAEHARRAGINSFGLGGANGHLVIEEPPVRPLDASDRPLHLLVLSARSEAALRTLAARYAEHIEAHPNELLADLCFTAIAGRAYFDHRLGIVAGSAAEARDALAAFASGTAAPGVFHGIRGGSASPARREGDSAHLPTRERRTLLEQLAARFVCGDQIDIDALDLGPGRRKLSLPTYPFERRRCWAGHDGSRRRDATAVEAKAARQEPPALIALLQTTPPARRQEALADFIASEVAGVLGIAPELLAHGRGFAEMGMKSLMAIELQARLQAAVGKLHALPSTLAFDRPTVAALGDYLARGALSHLIPLEPAPSRAAVSDAPVTPDTSREPIAIIGMACRFPGEVEDLGSFWRLLRDGVDAITEVPLDRWDANGWYHPDPDVPGKSYSRRGGFLRDVKGFDAEFFRISPREAASMDPQQRLTLEVSWEALANAGQTADRLTGSRTGVFIGALGSEYHKLRVQRGDPRHIDAYYGTGAISSAISGRVAHFMGLHGPTMTVDTACSSALVAVHLACQSLRLGECEVALAGGVNVILSPEGNVFLSRARALAADGKCKAFDASADGYVRSEGCGVVVLKRLSHALADGDEVLAVIAGSAINHDGPSSGFTVPSGPSQQALLRRALADAGVRPADVGYVEAHGTGTSLGDPIEAMALGAVLSEGRSRDNPFLLGSVKTNIGHLEAAAGIAGLIKVVLSLRHEQIPPHLHLRELNPRIRPEDVPASIPTQPVSWPAGEQRRIAGVSSFGLSGTNAHVVVAEAPPRKSPSPSPETPPSAHLLTFSARSEEALGHLARAYCGFLSAAGQGAAYSLRDICFTAGVRRSHHEHRLAVVGASHEQILERLEGFLAGEARPGLSSGVAAATGRGRRIVFVCPGQGSQWPSMGRRLLREEPAFREAIARCDEAMRPHVDWSLVDVLTSDEAAARLEAIDVIQPLLFAIEVALAALWSAWGIRPDAVIGHSMGEVAAAHIAGALDLEDAARVICRRSKLLRKLSGRGAMAVVDLPLEQARTLLVGREDRISIAVSNSPRSTVLSGDPDALAEVLAQLERDDVFCRLIKVDVASHSPQVDPIRDELLDVLAGLSPRPATIPIYSTVRADVGEGASFDAAYWVHNLRDPVLFSTAVQRALDDGYDTFVEISPHPILLPAIEQVMTHVNRTGIVLASLRREEDERAHMLSSLGALHVAGHPVQLGRIHAAGGQLAPLPPYPFQRERHWFEGEEEGHSREATGGTGRRRARVHPVLGERLELSSAPGLCVWETDVDVETLSYLQDHLVHGTAVLPGMAYIAMALTAADEIFGPGPRVLADIEFHRALFLPEGTTRTLQTSITPADDGGALVRVHSRPRSEAARAPGDGWVLHMSARIEPTDSPLAAASAALPSVAHLEERCGEEIAVAEFYRALERIGNHFGPRHQGIERLARGQGDAVGRVRLPRSLEPEADGYFMHPAFLDACCQVGLAAVPVGDEPRGDAGPLGVKSAFMPFRIDRLVAHRRPGPRVWSHARMTPRERADIAEDLCLFDTEGGVLVEIIGLQGRYLERSTEAALPTALEQWLYEIAWQPSQRAERASDVSASGAGKWMILADRSGVGEALAARLTELGESSVLVHPGQTYACLDRDRFCIRPGEASDMARLVEEVFGPGGSSCRGAVHLFSLDAPAADLSPASLRAAQTLVCTSAAHLVQALVARPDQGTSPRLWFVTRGAMRLGSDAVAPALAQAPLWGLGRVIAEEHPNLWGGLVDLCPDAAPAAQAHGLSAEVRSGDGEDQLAFRDGRRYVARLVRRPRAEGSGRALRLRADGTYLVTGGLGGIGLAVARWLVEQGARRLILMGRTPLPPRTEWAGLQAGNPFAEQVAAVRAIESLGASVHLVALDVGDEAGLRAFLAAFQREAWPPIRGVVHAAAVVHDRTVSNLDEATLQADLGPKMVGGYLLHRLLEDAPLDFFVLFSSGSAILSSPFLGAYAAANAFLDALAHHRRALGRTALSVNWGFWEEVGLAARRQKERGGSLAPQGMGSFTPAQGLEVMRMLLEGDATQTVVMPVNWKQWGQFHPAGARSPLLSELVREQVGREKPAQEGSSLRQALLDIEPGWRRRAKMEAHLREQVGQVLRLSPAKVGLHQALGSLGLDSLMGLELRRRFEASTGLTLPATLVWTYPTVSELSDHLAAQMGIPLEQAAPSPPADAGPPTTSDEPEDLSEEEAAALLAETLTMVRQRSTT
ncbi:type I polyketide synthase [Polyangium aurulentum]|uniref:type I polyketide synthase n=1 Tax=Polyangium aurulentum TaxID=2567896 RepID=UPI0010ADEEC3|nr:type I polyketide synthase [Polyangium aurulentum]UQA57015.1 SDR family NAD(P)-dependent oxidoreductase [Polyangium aurulentum]